MRGGGGLVLCGAGAGQRHGQHAGAAAAALRHEAHLARLVARQEVLQRVPPAADAHHHVPTLQQLQQSNAKYCFLYKREKVKAT